MTDTSSLMTIGQFSSLARISVRMLRHYDQHGVLVPAAVDTDTGYRHYAHHQVAEAMLVRQLRDIGFGVSAISALLAARGTPAYDTALQLQRATLEAELRAARQRLGLIDQMLTDTQELTMNPITVKRSTLPAMTVVSLRGTIPSYSDEGQLWQQLIPELQRQGITATGPGGCVEHDPTYVESDPDVSVWLPVASGTTVEAPVRVDDLPEQDAVVATVVGPYDLISQAHGRIGEFLAEHGLRDVDADHDGLAGKVVNRYLSDPSEVPQDQSVTEVYRPIG